MVVEREMPAWQWTRTAPVPFVCLLEARGVGLRVRLVSKGAATVDTLDDRDVVPVAWGVVETDVVAIILELMAALSDATGERGVEVLVVKALVLSRTRSAWRLSVMSEKDAFSLSWR